MVNKISFIFLIILISCTNNRPNISFSLNNKSIKCSITKDSIYKQRFATINEKDSSTNVVSFTFENNSNKKLLFLIKNKNLIKIVNCKINIYENNKLIKFNLPIGDVFFKDSKKQQKLFNYMDYIFEEYKNELQDLIKLGAKDQNYQIFNRFIEQSVVIYPGERTTMKSILQLPYMVENTIFNTMDPVYYDFVENVNYEFSLSYEMDAKKLKKIITKEQLEELAYNNVEIYDGIIETQRIPINVIFK